MNRITFVAVLLVAVCTVAVGTALAAGITGSEHDFSSKGWNPGGEICEPCHIPHNASTTPGAPLWNHDETTATFTVYSSLTLDATDVGQPSGTSKLCLSCHDGTVAKDSFGGATGTNFMTGNDLLGTDLGNDHPISFTYDTALSTADSGLFDPSSVNSGLGGTIDADLLFGNKLECASCHDVHDAAGNPDLLRKSNAASALCLTCHNK